MKRYILLLCLVWAAIPVVSAQDNPLGMKGAKPESAYTFSSSMTYEMTTTTRKGKTSRMSNKYYFSPKGTAVGMEFGESSESGKAAAGIDFMIIDIGQAKIFTFMESKMVIGMALRPDKLNETIEKENAAIRVTKTTEVKTIMGYECDGYSVKNEKDKSDVMMWVSRKRVESLAGLGTQMARAFAGSGKGGQTNYFAYNAHPELAKMAQEGRGILGYTTQSEKGDVTEMMLTAIEPKINYTFKAGDYKSMF